MPETSLMDMHARRALAVDAAMVDTARKPKPVAKAGRSMMAPPVDPPPPLLVDEETENLILIGQIDLLAAQFGACYDRLPPGAKAVVLELSSTLARLRSRIQGRL